MTDTRIQMRSATRFTFIQIRYRMPPYLFIEDFYMRKLVGVIFAIFGLGWLSTAFCSVKCPTAEELSQVQFYILPYTHSDNTPLPSQFSAFGINNLGTSSSWQVEVAVIAASTETEARDKLKKILSSASLVHDMALEPNQIPEPLRQEGQSICYFSTPYSHDPSMFVQQQSPDWFSEIYKNYLYNVLAVTPPDDEIH